MHEPVCFEDNAFCVVFFLCVPYRHGRRRRGILTCTERCPLRIPMNLNSDEFHQFLHDMGVEIENDHQSNEAPAFVDAEPSVTMLQLSREYRAFYQLNL